MLQASVWRSKINIKDFRIVRYVSVGNILYKNFWYILGWIFYVLWIKVERTQPIVCSHDKKKNHECRPFSHFVETSDCRYFYKEDWVISVSINLIETASSKRVKKSRIHSKLWMQPNFSPEMDWKITFSWFKKKIVPRGKSYEILRQKSTRTGSIFERFDTIRNTDFYFWKKW